MGLRLRFRVPSLVLGWVWASELEIHRLLDSGLYKTRGRISFNSTSCIIGTHAHSIETK